MFKKVLLLHFMAIIDSIGVPMSRRSGNAILFLLSFLVPSDIMRIHLPVILFILSPSNADAIPSNKLSSQLAINQSSHVYFTINAALGAKPASFSVMPKSP